jgi:hypothetical protein
MSSSYSSSLRVELIGSGDQAGTWGTTTDNNFAYIFDAAIAGYQAVTVTSTAQALTYVNGPTSSAALNQSVYAILKFNSAAAASAIYAPPVSKQYIIWNNSSYTITIYNSTVIGNTTAAGTGIAIVAGDKIMVWSDGTNFYDLQAQNLTGTLAIAKGGTGQTTANAAFNALAPSQTSANGKYLKSDGTNTSWDQIDISTGDITGTLPVLNGGTGVTTSTGSGNNVLSTNAALTTPTITSATLVTPALGTPASGNLANCTFPTLNQNTTGTAGGLTGTLAIASGGTGQTTAANAGSALGAIGVGQTTQDVTSSRAGGTTYTNSTGRPIMVYISAVNNAASTTSSQAAFVDGIQILTGGTQSNRRASYTFIVPSGSTYRFDLGGGDSLQNWAELRA